MTIFNLQSVGSKLKTFAYAGLFGGVVAGFGGIMYALYEEMAETSGSYGMIQNAVSRLESDQKLIGYLGQGPLKVYGQSNRYGRRRPHVISRFLDDGTRCYDTSFWVEGPQNHRKALVTLQVVQDGQKQNLKERYLAVDLVEGGRERIILIQPHMENKWKFSWNPFEKLFK